MLVKQFGYFYLVAWIFVFGTVSFAHASTDRPSYIPPQGVIKALPDGKGKLKLAIVGFYAPHLNQDEIEAWQTLLSQDMEHRKGLADQYEFVDSREISEKLKDIKKKPITPLEIFDIKTKIDCDFMIFIQANAHYLGWTWTVRVYSGATGVAVLHGEVPYKEKDLQGIRNRLEAIIHKGLSAFNQYKKTEWMDGPPSKSLLPESLRRFDLLISNIKKKKYGNAIDELEWIWHNNIEFYKDIQTMPSIARLLKKESGNHFDTARIHFITANYSEALRFLEMKGKFKAQKYEYARREALLGEVKLKLNRTMEAEKHFNKALHSAWGISGMLKLQIKQEHWTTAQKLATQLSKKTGWEIEGTRQLWFVNQKIEDEIKERLANPTVDDLNQKKKNKKKKRRKPKLSPLEKAQIDTLKAAKKHAVALAEAGHFVRLKQTLLPLLATWFDIDLIRLVPISLLSLEETDKLKEILSSATITYKEKLFTIMEKVGRIYFHLENWDEFAKVAKATLDNPKHTKSWPMMVSWFFLNQNKNLAAAQSWVKKIPNCCNKEWIEAELNANLGNYNQAHRLIKRMKRQPGLDLEFNLLRAQWYRKDKKYKKAKASLQKASKDYPADIRILEESVLLGRAMRDTSLERDGQAKLMLIKGDVKEPELSEGHLLEEVYKNLIMPMPVIGRKGSDQILPLQKAMVIGGDYQYFSTSQQWLSKLFAYLERDPERIVTEISQALSSRYEIIEIPISRSELEKAILSQDTFVEKEFENLARAALADSIFIITTKKVRDRANGIVTLKPTLYMYNVYEHTMYETQAEVDLDFLEVYQFNQAYIAVPFLFVLIGIFGFLYINKYAKRLLNPLEHAWELTQGRHYVEAAQILFQSGYINDFNILMGHDHAKHARWKEAMESFFRGKDYLNAIQAFEMSDESEECINLAAEIYMANRQFDQALAMHRRIDNRIGMARVAEAMGDEVIAARILGQYYFEMNNMSAAIEQYKAAEDFERAGLVYYFIEDFSNAAQMFQLAGNHKFYKRAKEKAKKAKAKKKFDSDEIY